MRFVSTTSSGTPPGAAGGYRGATLAELMAKQKMLQQRSAEIGSDYATPIASPWQGAAKMADAFVTARQGVAAEDEAGQAREALAGLYAGINPDTGATQDQLGQLSRIDPQSAEQMYGQAQALRLADKNYARNRADEITDRDLQLGLQRDKLAADTAKDGSWKPSDIGSLRDDYTKAATTYDNAAPSWQSMQESASRAIGTADTPGKGAADYAMVVSLAKILDPTSVVREGEVESVKQTGGPADYLVGVLNSLKSQGSLSDGVRKGLMTEGSNRMKAYYDQAATKRKWVSDIAGRHGVNPDDVVPPLQEFKPYGAEGPKVPKQNEDGTLDFSGMSDEEFQDWKKRQLAVTPAEGGQ